VPAGFERGVDAIDLAAVAAREDGDPRPALIPYPIEKIGAGPSCGESDANLTQVVTSTGARRRIRAWLCPPPRIKSRAPVAHIKPLSVQLIDVLWLAIQYCPRGADAPYSGRIFIGNDRRNLRPSLVGASAIVGFGGRPFRWRIRHDVLSPMNEP
jgi:hypothetical protein